MRIRVTPLAILVALVCSATMLLHGQEEGSTPGAIPDPSSYQGSMELQRQEQLQDQQQQQQNQQMLQRLDDNYRQYAPAGSTAAGSGSRGRAAGGSPPVDWWSKPPLPPASNPLLGRWKQVASKGVSAQQLGGAALIPGVADAAASLLNTTLAGGCNSMFGAGVVAFEPTSLQWVAPDGHEEVLNNVAYRASGSEVVVLSHDPGAIPALIFGLPNHDHAVVAFFNCTMDRVGAKPAATASTAAPSSVASATPTASPSSAASPIPAKAPPPPVVPAAPPPSGAANATLSFQVGASAAGSFTPFVGIKIWVTPENPQEAMAKAGLVAAGGSVSAKFLADCGDVVACTRDLQVMTAKALGAILTDATGHAQSPPIQAGRYFLVGLAPYGGKVLFWNHAVNLQPGTNSVTLDQTNGSVLR